MIISCFISTEKVYDNDTWWHLKTGEYILEQQYVPTSDIFSFYGIENNLNWTAHEWLSDVILFGFYDFLGFKGLILFPILLLSLTLYVLFHFQRWIKPEQYITFYIWLFMSGFILSLFSSTRPHMFSFLLFSITMYCIHHFIKEKINYIFILPVISLLWVNLHGGSSSLLFVVMFFLICSDLIPFRLQRIENNRLSIIQRKKLYLSFVLSLCTSLINPYGYHILLYPFTNMLDKTMLAYIVEWQSPNLHTPEGIIVFGIIAFAIAIILVSEKKISIFQIFILFSFLFLSFRSIRQISYFVIALMPIIPLYGPYFKFKFEKTKSYLIICLTFVVLFIVHYMFIASNPVNDKGYPKESLPYIEEEQPHRLLNDYNWGGYLIWHEYDKNIHPFIDGRADIFSKYTMHDYSIMIQLNKGWEQVFEKYDFDAAVLPSDSLLAEQILIKYNWKLKHKDSVSILITKN